MALGLALPLLLLLLLLRVVGVLGARVQVWVLAEEGVVVDLEVDVDVAPLLEVQGVVLPVLGSDRGWQLLCRPAEGRDGGDLGLHLARSHCAFLVEVVVDVRCHLSHPRTARDLLDTGAFIRLELQDLSD